MECVAIPPPPHMSPNFRAKYLGFHTTSDSFGSDKSQLHVLKVGKDGIWR